MASQTKNSIGTGTGTATAKPSAPELNTEVANRLRDPFENHYLGILRTNDPLLLERGNGSGQAFELYRDLARDGKVASVLQKRKLALIGKPWQVDPVEGGAAGQRDADVVSNMLKSVQFDRVCSELLDALLVGFVPAEIVWTYRDGLITPERIVTRAQRRFVYVQTDPNMAPELRLVTRENMLTGEELPPRKFIVHRFNAKDDNPYGMGLGLQLYWPVFFKRKSILSWNKLNDRFGSPTPWGKYPKSAGIKEKATLFEALKAMSNDGVMMTPEGMSIELLESKLTGSVTTQHNLCLYMDGWISEVVLSQEPGHTTGATGAAAMEREDVRIDLVQADADLLSDTLNSTLVKWFCEYNGLAMCQVSRIIKKTEDLLAASQTDVNIANLGFRPTLDAVREKYGQGWEDAPKPVAVSSAVPVRSVLGGKAVSFAELGRVNGDGAVDPLTQPLAQAGDSVVSVWMQQISKMVDTADTPQALRDQLVQAYGDLPTEQLTEVMALAFTAAELAGRYAVATEVAGQGA